MLSDAPRLNSSIWEDGTLHRGAHGVLIVFDDVDDRQTPELGHVEALVDLPLVGRAIAEVGEADLAVVAVLVGQRKARAQTHLRADDPVPAIKSRLDRKHVHGSTLSTGRAPDPAGEFSHHPSRIPATGQHMAVVTVAGDHLVAGPAGGL